MAVSDFGFFGQPSARGRTQATLSAAAEDNAELGRCEGHEQLHAVVPSDPCLAYAFALNRGWMERRRCSSFLNLSHSDGLSLRDWQQVAEE